MCRLFRALKPVTFWTSWRYQAKDFSHRYTEDFARELRKCKTDEEASEVGVEWCTMQAKDLVAHRVQSIHFTVWLATQSVRRVATQVY